MAKLINILRGKKTFIIAGLTIILGILQGNNEMIATGFGFIGIRLGMVGK